MNEVSVPPVGQSEARWNGLLATVGGACTAAANQTGCWLLSFFLYRIFQLFFIHKKRERGKGRKKKKLPFIKTCPGTKSPDMFFFFCPDKLKELHFVYFTSRLHLLYKKTPTSAGVLCINTSVQTDVDQLRNMHSCILVVFEVYTT